MTSRSAVKERFFACAKKSKQKKHTPAVRPPLCGGCAVPAGIFGRGHPAPAENGAHPCAPPCGFYPPGLPDLRGPASKSKRVRARARDLHVLLLLPFGAPMRHGERAG